jgi:hypothetical protein
MKIEVTLSVFNDSITLLNLGSKIVDIKNLNEKNYQPDSTTALYDAIMITYNKMRNRIMKNDRVIALVLTDGMENASKEYTNNDVQSLIQNIERKGGSFNFLCSTVDIGHYQEVLNIESDDCICFESSRFNESLKAKLDSVSNSILMTNE